MRRPTPLDRITREGRPKTWKTVIVRARAEGNDIILPDGPPSFRRAGRKHRHVRPQRRRAARSSRQDRPKTSETCHRACTARAAGPPSRSRLARFSHLLLDASPPSAHVPPFQMTHAVFHRKTPARSTQNRRRQSSAARNGACSPLRRVFRLGLSDESRHLLPRFRPCTATLAPQLCLPEGLRHTVFWNVLPKSCLFLLHGAFSMYIFFTNKEQNAPSQQKKQCE